MTPEQQASATVSPQIARVSIETLRRLHAALIGEGDAPETDALVAEVGHLIETARWSGEGL